MGWETAGDAALLALFSFAVQILLVFLRGGSSVRARIVPNHAQDHLLKLRDPQCRQRDRGGCSRGRPRHRGNGGTRRMLGKSGWSHWLQGEAYTSMFCSPIGWDGEPVTVTVRYSVREHEEVIESEGGSLQTVFRRNRRQSGANSGPVSRVGSEPDVGVGHARPGHARETERPGWAGRRGRRRRIGKDSHHSSSHIVRVLLSPRWAVETVPRRS